MEGGGGVEEGEEKEEEEKEQKEEKEEEQMEEEDQNTLQSRFKLYRSLLHTHACVSNKVQENVSFEKKTDF